MPRFLSWEGQALASPLDQELWKKWEADSVQPATWAQPGSVDPQLMCMQMLELNEYLVWYATGIARYTVTAD